MAQFNRLTYLCNAGVLLEMQDKKILIDAFCNNKIKLYKGLPNSIKQQLVLGTPPFDKIDLLLFTHHHSDHFDVDSTMAFLRHHKDTVVLSTSDVIGQLKRESSDLTEDNLIVVPPPGCTTASLTIRGIPITCFSMIHEGKVFADVENIAYLLHLGDQKILHVGDAKIAKTNYENLHLVEEGIDLLLVPFPYVGLPRGRQLIKRFIQPKKIAAVHLPYRELDSHNWIDITKKSYAKVKETFIETIFLEAIGTERQLPLQLP